MRIIRIKLNKDFDVVMPENYNLEEDKEMSYELLFKKFEEQIAKNNESINNIFWESLQVCGEVKSLETVKDWVDFMKRKR